MIVGYDDNEEHFIIRNSWGSSWGLNGYFYMPYNFILNPQLAMDFGLFHWWKGDTCMICSEYTHVELAHTIICKLLKGDASTFISVEQIKEALKTNWVQIDTKRNGFGEIVGYDYTLQTRNEKTI